MGFQDMLSYENRVVPNGFSGYVVVCGQGSS